MGVIKRSQRFVLTNSLMAPMKWDNLVLVYVGCRFSVLVRWAKESKDEVGDKDVLVCTMERLVKLG